MPIYFVSTCGKIWIYPESNYRKNSTQATSLHFTKKRAVILLDYIQKVIAFLSPDNCAILHNQYSGDGILLIGKILQWQFKWFETCTRLKFRVTALPIAKQVQQECGLSMHPECCWGNRLSCSIKETLLTSSQELKPANIIISDSYLGRLSVFTG